VRTQNRIEKKKYRSILTRQVSLRGESGPPQLRATDEVESRANDKIAAAGGPSKMTRTEAYNQVWAEDRSKTGGKLYERYMAETTSGAGAPAGGESK